MPEANLYSESLAKLLSCDEQQVLDDHLNYRCGTCGLVFKKRWFSEAVVAELFSRSVPAHPRGWDVVLGRFSATGFRSALDSWELALKNSETEAIRRGQRELTSILDSIVRPVGFDPAELATVIAGNDVQLVKSARDAIVASIDEPVPFKRFSGFRSAALWDYLQNRTGGFTSYAELGCPLWGLLTMAAERGLPATYLTRDEPNYWGDACVNAGESCGMRRDRDARIRTAEWDVDERYGLVGIFQYLDHLTDPRAFLMQLFTKSRSAAVIVDGGDVPLAVQHATGWNEASARYAAALFGKALFSDFGDIRASGNVLFLFTEGV